MLVRVSTLINKSLPVCCSLVESVSISINNVDIACSVSHLESKVDDSGAKLGTCLDPGLHSGVATRLLAQILGEDKINSEGPDLRGLGVLVALWLGISGRLMCRG